MNPSPLINLAFNMNKLLGSTIYYIKGRECFTPEYWKIIPIKVTEISRKLDRNGKDLGWAFIANGTRYKLSSLDKKWFFTKDDAEEFVENAKQIIRDGVQDERK